MTYREHNGHFHQLGNPCTESGNEPQDAHRAKHESVSEYDEEVENAGLEGHSHRRMKTDFSITSTVSSSMARTLNESLCVPGGTKPGSARTRTGTMRLSVVPTSTRGSVAS